MTPRCSRPTDSARSAPPDPPAGARSSTIGEQLAANHALTDPDEDHFVRQLIANLTDHPSYYAHMSPANVRGPGPAELAVPESLDAAELTRRLDDGEWVVDLRRRVAFANSHLKGSVSFEYGSGSSFTTYLGWVLPWGEPLTLVGSREDIESAIRDLSRIGIESPDAAVGTEPHALAPQAALASYPRVGWDGVLAGRAPGTPSWTCAGPTNSPLPAWWARSTCRCTSCCCASGDVPAGKLWVHCGSGYRAGIAASLLQRAGRDVVHIDARFADAASAGIALDTTAA